MTITVPVPNTELSVSGWGKPITDEVNRHSIYSACTPATNTSIPVDTDTLITWVNVRTNGITVSSTGLTIVTAGVYKVSGNILLNSAGGGNYAGAKVLLDGVVQSQSVGPTGAWMIFPLDALFLANVGQKITLSVSTNATTAKTDNRCLIVAEWKSTT